jgi:addiction module HigA family antidote
MHPAVDDRLRRSLVAGAPGDVLAQKLKALGVTPTELARQLQVPPNRITQILKGKRAISGDSALRLAHWFGCDPEYWMTLQAHRDLEAARADAAIEIKELPTNTRSVRRFANLPPLWNSNNFRQVAENIFVDIVSVNMLCVPREHSVPVGLRLSPVAGPEDDWRRAPISTRSPPKR